MTATEPLTLDLGLDDLVSPTVETGQSLADRYEAWRDANPWILTALYELARDELEHGAERLSIGHLVEVLRWHHVRATRGDTFRINNSYRSRLARDLMARNRLLDGRFETRTLHT